MPATTAKNHSRRGKSRRMTKQGPPPPLDESAFTKKRKAPHPEPEPPFHVHDSKKKKINGRGPWGPVRMMSGGLSSDDFDDSGLAQKQVKKLASTEKERNGKDSVTPKKGIRKQDASQLKNGDKTKDEVNGVKNTNGIAIQPKAKLLEVAPQDSDEDEEMPSDAFSESASDIIGHADEFFSSDEDSEAGSAGSDIVGSDVEDMKQAFWSEDEDEDDDPLEKLTAANIEGLSRNLDAQTVADAAAATAELQQDALQLNTVNDTKTLLDGDAQPDGDIPVPELGILRTRITDTILVLSNFAKMAEEGRSRADYITQLLKDICAYFEYSPYLAEKLYNLFPGPQEAFAFFEANEQQRPVIIRTNSLKTHRRELAQSLINRGVTLEPVAGKWTKLGLQIFESQVPIGATPEYLAGHYIIQAASSFLPVMALSPEENERVLDMAAAPGGKTTHMAALMRNTGTIFANDSNKSRAKGLIGNVHRLGVKNTIVCNYDAKRFPEIIGGFDRVLLDAPCSGTGVISKDQSIKTNKTEQDFMRLPHLQKQLILSAIDSVDHRSATGGFIVYSTCSVTLEENEQVVQYALNKRPNVRLVSTGLPFGKEGFTRLGGKIFHPSMKETRRFYPHAHNLDGFFVAKFKKIGLTPPNAIGVASTSLNDGMAQSTTAELAEWHAPVTPELTNGNVDDDFADFDNEEDDIYVERARRAALRRKGFNPKAAMQANKNKKN